MYTVVRKKSITQAQATTSWPNVILVSEGTNPKNKNGENPKRYKKRISDKKWKDTGQSGEAL
ncbi:hypothetical protein SD70_06420 [Gordoniibacillus kamchatkensis]|uniref:Uncharacterized protein n=1 Tax=Gordoniibacillus kamchatkensis TaxID=1590651 RepID=A0ABR5AKN6_9BACL|nr:hypothetical protein SD70_06420 [Paenibacillus sp. VKM B-2647]